MKGYTNALTKLFKANADALQATSAKKYMRDQFEFFGINTPLRRKLTKQFIAKHNIPSKIDIPLLVRLLWKLDEREYQYFAMEILERYADEFNIRHMEMLEFMLQYKAWWDTIDFIAPRLIGPYFTRYPKKRNAQIKKWMASGNPWLIRTALIFQMKYKNKTDTKLLFSLVNECKHEKDFFIRKAIGWALREYSKTNPKAVKDFVKNNTLSPLSKKEALKRM